MDEIVPHLLLILRPSIHAARAAPGRRSPARWVGGWVGVPERIRPGTRRQEPDQGRRQKAGRPWSTARTRCWPPPPAAHQAALHHHHHHKTQAAPGRLRTRLPFPHLLLRISEKVRRFTTVFLKNFMSKLARITGANCSFSKGRSRPVSLLLEGRKDALIVCSAAGHADDAAGRPAGWPLDRPCVCFASACSLGRVQD
jgi:hypothetical protein